MLSRSEESFSIVFLWCLQKFSFDFIFSFLLNIVVFNGKTFFDVGQPIRSLEGNSQTPLIQALN